MRNIERAYHKANLSAKWMKPKKCRARRSAFTSNENSVIDYDGEKPSREPGLNIPGSIYNSIDLCRKEIERVGLSDASHSQAPQGVSSGRAILALQGQDDERLALTSLLLETEYAQWGKNTLQFAHKFYEEKRKYSIVGDALAGAVWFFDRADLKSTKDVRCVPGSALPQNKLAKQENILALFQGGIYGDPLQEDVKVQVRRMLDLGTSEEVSDDNSVHETAAQKENLSMTSGQPVQVLRYDNHYIHLKIHLREMNTEQIRSNPQLYEIFAQHVDQTMLALSPQVGAQAGQVIPPQNTAEGEQGTPQTEQLQPSDGINEGSATLQTPYQNNADLRDVQNTRGKVSP